jgi:hypothetical protein
MGDQSTPSISVDERFFRPVSRDAYGPEIVTDTIRYWSKGKGMFKKSIHIIEYYWTDEEGNRQSVSVQSFTDAYVALR